MKEEINGLSRKVLFQWAEYAFGARNILFHMCNNNNKNFIFSYNIFENIIYFSLVIYDFKKKNLRLSYRVFFPSIY